MIEKQGENDKNYGITIKRLKASLLFTVRRVPSKTVICLTQMMIFLPWI